MKSGMLAASMVVCAGMAAPAQAPATPPAVASTATAAAKPAALALARPQIDPRTKSVIAGTSFLLPKPIYPVSDREDASYTVEYVFNYARYNYTPAVAIKDVNRVQASYATPEDAFTAFYSAIQSGDYDWMLNSWDEGSRKFIQDKNEKDNQGQAYWVNLWKQRYAGKKIEMVQRLESGLYVLILYRITDPDTGKIIEQDTLPMNLEHKKWLATQSLAADPLAVLYPDLPPARSQEVLMTDPRKAPNPNLPPGAKQLTREDAQHVFLKNYPGGDKEKAQVVER